MGASPVTAHSKHSHPSSGLSWVGLRRTLFVFDGVQPWSVQSVASGWLARRAQIYEVSRRARVIFVSTRIIDVIG